MPDILFADFETRSAIDLTVVGAYKYSHHPSTEATVLSWIFNDAPYGHVWSPRWCWGNTSQSTHDDGRDLGIAFDHVRSGGYVVFWNSFFDRHIWNDVMHVKYDWPFLKLEQVLCAQAQGEANNLPGALGKAAECLGTGYRKDPKGSQLISQLCSGTRDDWDSEVFEVPAKMGHFRKYALDDVLTMRDVWECTRPLMMTEWAEFHASERINDRGVMVDVQFARAAQTYAQAEEKDINIDLADLTGDDKMTVTNHLRKARWLFDNLWPDPDLQSLVSRPPKKDKPDVARYSADRPTREAVLDLIVTPEHTARFEPQLQTDVIEFIELIEAGNSAAVRKFTSMVNQAYEGRVYGCYSMNGAGQTGRFSSRGLQVHNIIRAPVEKDNPDRALDAIEMVLDGATPQALEDEFGYPLSRLLARLIRPTFIAPEGKIFIWGDWGQIEGRVLPWLSATPGGDAKLDLYRAGVDVYSATASQITGTPLSQVNDAMRQSMGKVPELALGFGGAAGAFAAMGRNYGVVLPVDQVKKIVSNWRDQNAWCVQFWHSLWDAAMAAFSHPGEWFPVGRVRYLFHPALMHGTLICSLPDGRWIVYPQFRHERVIVEDDEGEEIIRWRTSCMKGFGGGYGRIDIWYGTLAENITQATAASFLRAAIVEVGECVNMDVVLHTHDELVIEVPDNDYKQEYANTLSEIMTYLPEWADGLPLAVDIKSGPFYTK